jgi:CheY-like chemotaxis protein
LRIWGHEAVVAYEGTSALEAFRSGLPDVVLLDLGLPGQDGFDVATRMRQLDGGQHVPVVAVTGYGGDAARLRTGAAGFDLHLVKPVDPEALRAFLETLARAKAKRSAGADPP